MPGFVRKAAVQRLGRLTAEAFGLDYPGGHWLSPAAILDRYAAFTFEHAEALLQDGACARQAAVEHGLFSNARRLGARLRALLGVRRHEEAMTVARSLYRMIGIDFTGCAQGTFLVRRCFFSSRYSPKVCRLISWLDSGLISGLTNGGELVFTHRVTEGAALCKGEVR